MFRILLHDVVLLLTLFPGAILTVVNRIPGIRKYDEMTQYGVCLAGMLGISTLMMGRSQFFVDFSLAICMPLLLFSIHSKLNGDTRGASNYAKKIRQGYFIFVLYPICEEIVYRDMLCRELQGAGAGTVLCIILSSFVFVGVHLFKQSPAQCARLFPFAIVEATIFLYAQDIYLCVFIHSCFNSLSYQFNVLKRTQQRYSMIY